MDFTWSPYWIFLRGLNHDFGHKLEKFHLSLILDKLALK